jgi:hypothetical protein
LRNGSAVAGRWNTDRSAELAKLISSIPSLYCGPASIGWIAAVWNESKSRRYELKTRLADKNLFSDGPRPFHRTIPFFQASLNDMLARETDGDLRIANETYLRCEAIHEALQQFEMPLIIRMPGKRIRDGIHYVTLYRSEFKQQSDGSYDLEFSWQDNGLFGSHTGLSRRIVPKGSRFYWGAKRIIES